MARNNRFQIDQKMNRQNSTRAADIGYGGWVLPNSFILKKDQLKGHFYFGGVSLQTIAAYLRVHLGRF